MRHWFTTTHWSVVMLARPDSPQAREALEKLCQTYWLPLYSCVRRQGYGPHDAQDLTQGFFVRLLRTDSLGSVSREKGKFRTFLQVALSHFLSDERDKARAEKRGGGRAIVSLDESEAEDRYLHMPSADLTPERVYDRRWALTVLELGFERLRQEYRATGREALFDSLKEFLCTEARVGTYESLGPKLGMSPGSVAVAVHRLRQRCRELIRLEVAQTVSNPGDLDMEIDYLFAAIGGQ